MGRPKKLSGRERERVEKALERAGLPDDLIPVHEVARRLGITVRALVARWRRGKFIPLCRCPDGHGWLARATDLKRYMQGCWQPPDGAEAEPEFTQDYEVELEQSERGRALRRRKTEVPR